MAPIKFEENLKEKLEQRTINPSAKSWEALATKLDAEEVKGTNKMWWLGIAASFVGLLLVFNVLFKNETDLPIENVVEVEPKSDTIKTDEEAKKEQVLNKTIDQNNVVENIEENKTKKSSVGQPKKTNSYLAATTPSRNRIKEVKKEENIANNIVNTSNTIYYASNEIKNNINNEVIKEPNENAVATSATEVIKITDNELDALLKHAESKITETNPNNTVPLDYNALLQDVEDDLEETFRDKLLKTVKGGYHSVKTYVAERND